MAKRSDNGITILNGWIESIRSISDRVARAELAEAIINYAYDGTEYQGKKEIVRVMMKTISASIDFKKRQSEQNAENGRRGGNPALQAARAESSVNPLDNQADNRPLNHSVNTDKEKERDRDKEIKVYSEEYKENAVPSTAPTISPKTKKFDFKGYLLEHGASEQAVNDWLEVRKKLKAANTLTAIKLLESEAEKAGISLAAAVELCAGKSWRGLKAEWIERENKPTAESEGSDYIRAMNAQIRRQREIDAELEAERQRRKRETANNNK